MKIKKIGHCCLLIKLANLTILTDPGAFTEEQNSIVGIDLILITHEHADHLHTGSIKEIIRNNPEVVILTNTSVGRILESENISYNLLEGAASTKIHQVLIEAFDGQHEEIFEEIGQVQNTGYLIDNKLFYPGDSYIDPKKSVDILALPVAGPWCKILDTICYALKINAKKVFPVHDGMLQKDKMGGAHQIPKKVLEGNGISFTIMNNGDEINF